MVLLFQCLLTAGPNAAPQSKVVEPVVVEHQRVHFGSLPDRTLVKFRDRREGQETHLLASQSDDGVHWSKPELLRKDHPLGLNPTPLFTRDGELHLFNIRWRGGRKYLDIWYTRSLERWKKWTEPRPVFQGYGGGGPMHPTELENGRIVMAFDYRILGERRNRYRWSMPGEGVDAFTYHGPFVCTTIYSDDGGKSWQLGNTVRSPVPDVGTYGANEPVALPLEDGRLWMLMRTQMGRQYESFSRDGLQWSPARPSRFLSSDSPALPLRLSDGSILLFWNNCLRFPYAYGGRQVLHAALSHDEGRTWLGFREVFRDPHRNEIPPPKGDHGTGYVRAAETKGGNIYFSAGQHASARTLLFNPEWLLTTRVREDFPNGLENWSVFGTRGVELVPHPEPQGYNAEGSLVLSIQKEVDGWPAAAVWNFPNGKKGMLRLKLQLREGFDGARISLTDHFSVPFDTEAEVQALYDLTIRPDARLAASKIRLEPGRWHRLDFRWDFDRSQCSVFVDDESESVSLPQLRAISDGVNYLRLRSTSEKGSDRGFLVESVQVEVF